MVDDFSKAKLHITILPDAEYILLSILANMAKLDDIKWSRSCSQQFTPRRPALDVRFVKCRWHVCTWHRRKIVWLVVHVPGTLWTPGVCRTPRTVWPAVFHTPTVTVLASGKDYHWRRPRELAAYRLRGWARWRCASTHPPHRVCCTCSCACAAPGACLTSGPAAQHYVAISRHESGPRHPQLAAATPRATGPNQQASRVAGRPVDRMARQRSPQRQQLCESVSGTPERSDQPRPCRGSNPYACSDLCCVL